MEVGGTGIMVYQTFFYHKWSFFLIGPNLKNKLKKINLHFIILTTNNLHSFYQNFE